MWRCYSIHCEDLFRLRIDNPDKRRPVRDQPLDPGNGLYCPVPVVCALKIKHACQTRTDLDPGGLGHLAVQYAKAMVRWTHQTPLAVLTSLGHESNRYRWRR